MFVRSNWRRAEFCIAFDLNTPQKTDIIKCDQSEEVDAETVVHDISKAWTLDFP